MSKGWLSPKVEVRNTPAGKRLVTLRPIADDEQITRRGDDKVLMLTSEEFREFANQHTYKDAVSMPGGFKRVTVSVDKADPSNYAVKSPLPNAYDDGDGLIAIRHILAGEEISVSEKAG